MTERGPAGLGGWLIVLLIGQILYVLQHFRQAFAVMEHGGPWTPFLLGEIVGQVLVPLLVLYCTVLLVKERRRFPSMFLVQVWLIAGLNSAGVALAAARLREPHGMAVELVLVALNLAFAAVGTLYILRSKRVRNTFVR